MPHDSDYETTDAGKVRRWKAELDLADKEERDWRERARKIVKRYRDEDERSDSRFNILWSNTETLKPALYSQTPEPDIRRRFKDEDPVAREASETLERAVAYSVDSYDFDATMNRTVLDLLLTGRGVARVRYIPTIQQREAPSVTVQAATDEEGESEYFVADLGNGPQRISADDVQQTPDGMPIYQPDPEEEVVYEEARCEYVNWDDLRISPARTWGEVRWVAFRHRMTRKQLEATFDPGLARKVPLDHAPEGNSDDMSEDKESILHRATVWEIWDKDEKQVVFIAHSMGEQPLEEREDPLGLGDFFPIPKPLYSLETNNTLVPVPEYTLYQDQAEELNTITHRIERLVEALKVRGLYPGEHSDELSRLMSGDDNELIPVRDFGALAQQYGSLENAIAWMPLEQIAKSLQGLYQQRDQLIQTIYQITGISDIMRGATDPRETRGAQEIKAQFGSLRMRPRQKGVERFVRDLFQKKAEIMAEHFSPDTLQKMTGTQVPEQVMALMQNDGMRGFRIDVETDSTVATEEQQDKEEVTEMFQALSGLLQQAAPAVQQGVFSMDAARELVKFGMRRFKVSRQVEEAFDQMGEGAEQKQEQPDPIEVQKIKNERLKIQQQAQKDQVDQKIRLLELKRQYAEMDMEDQQHMIDAAIDLTKDQESAFREEFNKVMDVADRERDREVQQEQARQQSQAQGGS